MQSEIMNPESTNTSPIKQQSQLQSDLNIEKVNLLQEPIIAIDERISLVQKRIFEEVKKSALKESMDQVKRQMEEDKEGLELEDIYKEKLASEIETIGATFDQSFYEMVKSKLPESLDEFFQILDPTLADNLELQRVLAKYGNYVFEEIKHAKVMHRLILEQLARDNENANLRKISDNQPVQDSETSEDAVMTIEDNSDLCDEDLQMAVEDLSEFQLKPADQDKVPDDKIILLNECSDESDFDSCLGLIE